MIEQIDGEKVRKRIADIDVRLQEIRKLEDEKQEWNNVLEVMEWYWTEKKYFDLEKDVFEKDTKQWVKKNPFRTGQVRKNYGWLKGFPVLAIFKGRDNSTRFLAGSSTDEGLIKRSQESDEGLQRSGIYDVLVRKLKPYLKSKSKLAELSPSNT
jgi:hypothetical protein